MFNFFKKSSKAPVRKDPVCGMDANDAITLEHEGTDYAFCSDHCRNEFKQNPERYTA